MAMLSKFLLQPEDLNSCEEVVVVVAVEVVLKLGGPFPFENLMLSLVIAFKG